MTIDIVIQKSVCEYSGDRFYIAYYNGDSCLAEFVNGTVVLCTNNEISKDSKLNAGCFMTPVGYDEIENLFRAKMYVTYKGNEYVAVIVNRELERVTLQARKGMEDEDIKLGFKWDAWERTTWKTIPRYDIEDIRIERTSVYDEFRQEYESNKHVKSCRGIMGIFKSSRNRGRR